MNITLFIDWDHQKILRDGEHLDYLKKRTKELFEESCAFSDFIDEQYTPSEIYRMLLMKDDDTIREAYRKRCEEYAEDEDPYDEVNIEI